MKKFTFSVPLTETVQSNNGEFLITGRAINETVTRNGHKFVADELTKSAPSLRNRPILKDHENSVDSVVGRTTQNVRYNEEEKAIIFEGKIIDETVQEKIREGLIDSVSVGAIVQRFDDEKDDDGHVTALIARGIDFVELSLVAIPADPGATFALRLAEAYDGEFHIQSQTDKEKAEAHTARVTKKQEEADTVAEQTKIEALRAERAQLEEELEALKVEKLKREKESLTQAPVKEEAEEEADEPEGEPEEAPEPAAAPVADETKGETGTTEQATAKHAYAIEQNGRNFNLVANYDAMDLKRLKR